MSEIHRSFLGVIWHPTRQAVPPPRECACCGASVMSYRRTLSVQHLDFMRALAEAKGEPRSKQQLKGLTYTARNTGHLAFLWGLVTTVSETGRGGWVLTEAGQVFLGGRVWVPKHCVASSLSVAWFECAAVTLDGIDPRPGRYEDYREQITASRLSDATT